MYHASPTASKFFVPQPPSAFELDWSANDPEALPPALTPGTAVCPTCGRALFSLQASAFLDLLLETDAALGTAQARLQTLKAVVERTVIP